MLIDKEISISETEYMKTLVRIELFGRSVGLMIT